MHGMNTNLSLLFHTKKKAYELYSFSFNSAFPVGRSASGLDVFSFIQGYEFRSSPMFVKRYNVAPVGKIYVPEKAA